MSDSIGVLVAYRDRPEHLHQFVPYMRDYLPEHCSVHVIEQAPGLPFNRGALFNAGALEHDHNTLVFHDVDMLPVNARYRAVDGPEHWCGTATQFSARRGRPYEEYFGGVTAVDRASLEAVNGFSNGYWGWGAEDDDLRERFRKEGVDVVWRDYHYRSLPHSTESHSHEDLPALRRRLRRFIDGTGYDHADDGLSTASYEVTGRAEHDDYDVVTVEIERQ